MSLWSAADTHQAASGPQMYLVWPSFKILGSLTNTSGPGNAGQRQHWAGADEMHVPQEPHSPATSLILRPIRTVITKAAEGVIFCHRGQFRLPCQLLGPPRQYLHPWPLGETFPGPEYKMDETDL